MHLYTLDKVLVLVLMRLSPIVPFTTVLERRGSDVSNVHVQGVGTTWTYTSLLHGSYQLVCVHICI